MPATAAELHALLDAGHDPGGVIEAAQPLFDRSEAEGDEQTEGSLYGLVETAWSLSQHPDDRAELTALRDAFRSQPGRVVARAAEAALARRPALDPSRQASYDQLARAGYLVGRVERWSGQRKRPPRGR